MQIQELHFYLPTPYTIPYTMKTPERWRALPRCALFVSILAQKLSKDVKTAHCDVMWRHRRAVTSCYVRWQDKMALCNLHRSHHKKKLENHNFENDDLDLWPMTLTFELIRDIVIFNQPTKFWVRTSNGSVGRVLTDKHTHTQTDRFYTLDRWRGREQCCLLNVDSVKIGYISGVL